VVGILSILGMMDMDSVINMMGPASGASSSEASVNQGPHRNDAGQQAYSNAGLAHSPAGSFPSVPSSLSPVPSDPSTSR